VSGARRRVVPALAAFTAVTILCGCAASADRARVPMASSVTAAASPSPPVADGALLQSRPATLDAARAEAAHRPAQVAVPGYPGFSPVQARTTDPVGHGLDLPTDAHTVAWWSSGSMPGDPVGTVVLAAHVSYNGSHGPFTHLDRLRQGDVIVVRQADGSTRRYRMTGSHHVVKSALNRQNLFRTDGPPQLALITCGGSYDAATRNYSDNIIVFAAPVG